MVGGIATAYTTLTRITAERRRDVVLIDVSAAVLLIATLMVAIGLAWLPTYREDDIGPAWGVWVPLFAAVWVLVTHLTTQELGE